MLAGGYCGRFVSIFCISNARFRGLSRILIILVKDIPLWLVDKKFEEFCNYFFLGEKGAMIIVVTTWGVSKMGY